MSISAISQKVVSTLGNPSSLVPIMIKDGVDSASLTYYSYKAGGKVEGFDRALDEFGTQAIWIGGIPFFKKLIDKTAYKFAKLNPGVDVRIISNKDYAAWAVKNAKGNMSNNAGQTVAEALKDSLKNVSKTKNLYIAKIAAATALTIVSYFTLTKMKQKMTKNTVEKDTINKEKQQGANFKGKNNDEAALVPAHNDNSYPANLFDNKSNAEFLSKVSTVPKVFNSFDKNNGNEMPAFKGMAKNIVEGIMFNPVHNMKLIDASITSERLAQSRNKTEFVEHAIKEGIFLFFIYGLGNVIQKGVSKLCSKVLKTPIDLDIQVLMSKELKNSLKNGQITKDLAKLPKNTGKFTDVLDFIVKNPDNILVQAAKKSGIISTVAKTADVNTSKFISKEAIESLADNLKIFESGFKESGKTIKAFLNKSKGLKVGAVMGNLLLCCFVLGYVVPNLVYKYRKEKTGTTDFHVAKDIEKATKEKLKKTA